MPTPTKRSKLPTANPAQMYALVAVDIAERIDSGKRFSAYAVIDAVKQANTSVYIPTDAIRAIVRTIMDAEIKAKHYEMVRLPMRMGMRAVRVYQPIVKAKPQPRYLLDD
jgi:hypothetical protein